MNLHNIAIFRCLSEPLLRNLEIYSPQFDVILKICKIPAIWPTKYDLTLTGTKPEPSDTKHLLRNLEIYSPPTLYVNNQTNPDNLYKAHEPLIPNPNTSSETTQYCTWHTRCLSEPPG
jgi:hypothetical protein